jgi:uncharacterized membrane protein
MESSQEREAAWGEQSQSVRRWSASLAVLAAIVLYLVLPDRLIVWLGPRWLIPVLEGVLAIVILIVSPRRISQGARDVRVAAIALISVINLANVVSLVELIHTLLYSSRIGGRVLVYASVPVWLTNVIVFALWFWELDRGGPAERMRSHHREPDFLFPQMSLPGAADTGWSPRFLDYLYTSFTNATAFSPTDTMPLTSWAKLLMMVQSLASLLTVALVVSRAVNILN